MGNNQLCRDGIQAAAKDGNPAFLLNPNSGDIITAHLAVLQGVSLKGCFVSKRGRVDCFFPDPLATQVQIGYRGPRRSGAHAEQAESLRVDLLL